MKDIDIIFNKLFEHYNISTIKDLSEKIDVPQSTISKWRQRSSISPIKRKCKQLNIYSIIFEDSIELTKDNFKVINNKLANFDLGSLIYLNYLCTKTEIKNYNDYLTFQIERDKENTLTKFLNEFYENIKKDNIMYIKDREKLDTCFEYFLNFEEVNYLFDNKEIFMESINFIIKNKRKIF